MALHPPIQGIELFSGVGMLGEGLRAGFDYLGLPYRAICHVEREAHAAGVLVARMEEGSLDAAPVWSDVTTFPAERFRGKVDFVVAGFPCQDMSVAGRREGLDGARSGLFFNTIDVAEASGAWGMLLENVAGIFSANASVMDETDGFVFERACARVVGELSDRGWNAEWITLSASDVGANHGRARWFCLAWRYVADAESGGRGKRIRDELSRRTEVESASEPMADAARHVGDGGGNREGRCGRGVCETGDELGDSTRDGRREGRSELPWWSRRSDPCWASMPMADSIGQRSTWISRNRKTGTSERCDALAYSSITRLQRHEQQPAHDQNGRTDGRTDGARITPINYRISS